MLITTREGKNAPQLLHPEWFITQFAHASFDVIRYTMCHEIGHGFVSFDSFLNLSSIRGSDMFSDDLIDVLDNTGFASYGRAIW